MTIRRRSTAPAPAAQGGTTESGPLLGPFSLFYSFVEIGTWLFCSFQQLITTHDSIVGILHGGVLVPSNMTAQQLYAFLNSNMDKYNRIAWTIALIVQVVYWGTVMPGSPVHSRLLHRIIVWAFFIVEVLTDVWYSVATDTTLGGAITFIFNWGNGGWLVSLLYIAAMSVGSMFMGIRGFSRLQRVLAPVFRTPASTSAAA